MSHGKYTTHTTNILSQTANNLESKKIHKNENIQGNHLAAWLRAVKFTGLNANEYIDY